MTRAERERWAQVAAWLPLAPHRREAAPLVPESPAIRVEATPVDRSQPAGAWLARLPWNGPAEAPRAQPRPVERPSTAGAWFASLPWSASPVPRPAPTPPGGEPLPALMAAATEAVLAASRRAAQKAPVATAERPTAAAFFSRLPWGADLSKGALN